MCYRQPLPQTRPPRNMKGLKNVMHMFVKNLQTGDIVETYDITEEDEQNEATYQEIEADFRKEWPEPYYAVGNIMMVECQNCFNVWDGNAQCTCVPRDKSEGSEDKKRKHDNIEHQIRNEDSPIMDRIFNDYLQRFESIREDDVIKHLSPLEQNKLMLWVADKIAHTIYRKYVRTKLDSL